MRGLAAEARAWSAKALAGTASGDGSGRGGGWIARDEVVDAVTLLLPDSSIGDRVADGRGPLLRRLQTNVPGVYAGSKDVAMLMLGGGPRWKGC